MMPDVWATFTELDAAMQERLAGVLETRGADDRQRAMRRAFLSVIDFPANARVLEVGCGTGVLTRVLATWEHVRSVVGVDVAPALLDKARELAADIPNITFQEGDARVLPFDTATYDVVVFDSTLSHVPQPDAAISEAYRVLKSGGLMAVFDGDYATTTVALSDHDPLQRCVDAMMAASVHDRWLVRRLPALVREAGFDDVVFHSYGYVETTEGAYMLTVIDRGAETLRAQGQLDEASTAALKAEARRRVRQGLFFGHIAYASVVARKAY